MNFKNKGKTKKEIYLKFQFKTQSKIKDNLKKLPRELKIVQIVHYKHYVEGEMLLIFKLKYNVRILIALLIQLNLNNLHLKKRLKILNKLNMEQMILI